MRSFHRFKRLVPVAAAAGAALALIGAAQAGPAEPVVPTDIAVPAGNKVFLVGHAIGVQIYSCDATASGFAWTFVAPRADLYGDNGQLVATHYAGPTWLAMDGSTAVGSGAKRVTVDATAIPWLRLSAATTPGEDGDRLVGTTYIQRIATTGGLAPSAADCNAGSAGVKAEVPYTADYYFWKETTA